MTAENSRKALVIGGCRGIGKAISERLAKDGFEVTATCRKQGADSAALVEAITAAGGHCNILELDVCDRAAARTVLAETFPTENPPDVVVYNSGIAKDNLFVFMDDNEWESVLDTNLNGFYNTVQPLVFGMLAKRRGRVLIISSASGQTGQAGQVNYSATKAALIGAAKALAREVGRKGVLVNVVAPGVIETDMTKDLPKDQILPLIPLHRTGKVAEIAGTVSFLCGPDSTYIHGQVIAVNGGLVI